MLVKNFIKDALLVQIDEMTVREAEVYAYLGFILISQSVEFLGACLDPYPWGQKNISAERFELAIKKLFPKKYLAHNLYKSLRCSMTHAFIPGEGLGLSERKHEQGANLNGMHLKKQDGKLILIYEDMLKDFKCACQKVIYMIENNEIKSDKVYGHILSVPSD